MACDTDIRRLRFHGKPYTGQTMTAYSKNTRHEFFIPSEKAEPHFDIEVTNSGMFDSIVITIDSKEFHDEVWLHIHQDEFAGFADNLRTLLNDSE